MDKNMKQVLERHEYEFMQAYNIYVKKKEKELIKIIETLEKRNKNNSQLDQKMKTLEATVNKLRKDADDNEKKMESLRKEIKD